MGRKPTTLAGAALEVARREFEAGSSNRQISLAAAVSQPVWERALRAELGDAAFEHQLAQNKRKNTPGRRATKETSSRFPRPQQRGRNGKTIQVVCVETGAAFGSINKAAVALSVPYHQIRNNLLGKGSAFRPDGRPISFRRWRKGDPEVEVRPSRKSIPLRFEDGRVWPSVAALIKDLGGEARHVTRFCRRLKELDYGPGSPPLALEEMLPLAELMPFLQRKQLEDRIRSTSR